MAADVAEWRFGRGWTERELRERLQGLARLGTNFSVPESEMTPERGWHRYFSEAVIAQEPPGAPLADGPFQRAKLAVENYLFSDPAIVAAHFDPASPLLGRRLLIEIKVWGLHYLNGVVVRAVRSDAQAGRSTFGFRYDTLEGHIERGFEWFLLIKEHGPGEIRSRIDATWRPGQFPNAWSRLGFHFLAPRYQKLWYHRAQSRLSFLARHGTTAPPAAGPGGMVHQGPEVVFEVVRGRRVR